MVTLRRAAEQALEASENAEDQLAKPYSTDASNAITALREALVEPEQEPVFDCPRCGHCCPQRKPLTEKEIRAIRDTYYRRMGPIEFARAIEAAHGIGEKHE